MSAGAPFAMPRRIGSRSERVAREHDEAAAWLAMRDGARVEADVKYRRRLLAELDRSAACREVG